MDQENLRQTQDCYAYVFIVLNNASKIVELL